MACLVVDDAKCVAGMGRGAHRGRTSGATPRREGHLTCQKQCHADFPCPHSGSCRPPSKSAWQELVELWAT
eukprot:9478806-Pyramimonas_sp.AAC.1